MANSNTAHSYLENGLQKLQINYLTGAETTLWRGWGMRAPARISYNKIYYILQGTFHFEINGETFEGQPGQMFFLPCNAKQSYHAYGDCNARKMWIHFTAQCGEKDLFETVDVRPFITVEEPEKVERIFRTIFRCSTQGTVSNILELKAAVLQLLAYYMEGSNILFPDLRLDDRFEQVIRYIDDHLAEEIRLDDLAQLMYLNSNYFIKFFKRNSGMAPIEYVVRTRVYKAKQYLQSSDMPIKDIAAKCGFASVYYFDRVFKRCLGFTPSEYRRWAVMRPEGNEEESPPPAKKARTKKSSPEKEQRKNNQDK